MWFGRCMHVVRLLNGRPYNGRTTCVLAKVPRVAQIPSQGGAESRWPSYQLAPEPPPPELPPPKELPPPPPEEKLPPPLLELDLRGMTLISFF